MKLFFVIIGILIYLSYNGINANDGTCSINIQDLSINQPLFIKPGTNEFFFPNGYRKISLNNGEQIEFYCEKKFRADSKNQKLILTCGKDQIDKYLECNDQNYETARFMNKNCRYFRKDAVLIEIGFQIFDNFFKLMEICYNKAEEYSIYTQSELGPYSGNFQMNVARENFKDGIFHPHLNISRLYSKFIQKKTFETILGLKSANKYMESNSLARGHLAPMADFIYATQQLATFYYINVAPQWHTFNSGNWENLEKNLRKFASKRNLNLEIYTGTYGVAKLLSDTNDYVDLYLQSMGKEKKIPVPKIYYKIIIDKATRNGIVIIGVNNPHINEIEIKQDYVICKDIKENLKWIHLNSDEKYGYMYACTVQDFVNVVDYMRFVKVKGILYG